MDRPADIRSNRFEAEITASSNERLELHVLASEDGSEFVAIGYDPTRRELYMDTAHCGTEGRRVTERAPLLLDIDEELHLNVFVDGSVVEVFANGRQAITRLCYPTSRQNNRVAFSMAQAEVLFAAWELDYTNPY